MRERRAAMKTRSGKNTSITTKATKKLVKERRYFPKNIPKNKQEKQKKVHTHITHGKTHTRPGKRRESEMDDHRRRNSIVLH